MSRRNRLELPYGAADPLEITVADSALVAELAGPRGAEGPAAERLVAAATSSPADGPPLVAHVVPGDKAAVAVSGSPPQAQAAVAAIVAQLTSAGITMADISVLHAGDPCSDLAAVQEFHAEHEADTSYLAADDAGRPLHLARALVDADVVVTVGEWGFDAMLGGRSLTGELWPAFARQPCRDELLLALARRGRGALRPWLAGLHAITWQLGVTACLRLVAGRGGTLAAAAFGTAATSAGRARHLAAEWAPAVDRPADLTVCSLSNGDGDFRLLARAVAAAARVTRPNGTICVATASLQPPGPVVTRWRQGAPLQPLLREACAADDRGLVADAVVTRFLARGLAERRLVLLSNLDEAMVEDLGFGYAATPNVISRLAGRSTEVIVLHEADRMFPSIR